MDRKRVTVYVTEQEHKELKSFCAKLGDSMSNFIDSAIREKIKRKLEEKK